MRIELPGVIENHAIGIDAAKENSQAAQAIVRHRMTTASGCRVKGKELLPHECAVAGTQGGIAHEQNRSNCQQKNKLGNSATGARAKR